MKNLVLVVSAVVATALGAGLMFPQPVMAEDIDERRPVDVGGVIKIKNLRGNIKIEGWDEAEVHIEGELDELATGLRFEVDGDEAEIEVKMPNNNVNWGDGSDLVIRVPEQSRVLLDSVSTDVYAENLRAGAHLRTISGEIELNDSEALINLKTVSGEISVSGTQGELLLRSSSGEIEVRSHVGNADVETMSGEIDLEASRAQNLRGATVSGEIAVEAEFLQGVNAEFTSVSGEISINIEDPKDLYVLANTVSGNIDNSLTDDAVKEAFGQSSLKTTLGDGSGTLNVRAVSGAIELDEG